MCILCTCMCLCVCEHRSTLTPSLPWRHLRTTHKCMKCETLKPFFWSSFFAPACERIFMKTSGIENMLQDREVYCSQARLCIFLPRNFTGWGSEGVNNDWAPTLTCVCLTRCLNETHVYWTRPQHYTDTACMPVRPRSVPCAFQSATKLSGFLAFLTS